MRIADLLKEKGITVGVSVVDRSAEIDKFISQHEKKGQPQRRR